MTAPWRTQAACRPAPGQFIGAPDTVTFPSRPAGNWRNHTDLWQPAKAMCHGCPVTAECLAEALEDEARDGGERHGIRGGKTPEERRQQVRNTKSEARTRATTTTGDCATERGYRAHLRRGEQACAECRRAAAIHRREREQARAGAA